MCGIVGIHAKHPVNQVIFNALTILQHRGQNAAGIMTADDQRIHLRKDNGLVRDVIREQHMAKLTGTMGIGHVRYPTAGTNNADESQPFYVNSPYGLGIVHNGNLTNATALVKDLIHTDLRHLNTHSDSEVLLNVVAHELQLVAEKKLTAEILFSAMQKVYQRLQGAFAVLLLIHGYGLVAFRDPHGIRPLVYGKREGEHGTEYMFASESIALDACGFERIADVAPGEVIFCGQDGVLHQQICASRTALHPCLFEYIYLSRPDSIINDVVVDSARANIGKKLAQHIAPWIDQHPIDTVIPIPDTSRTVAMALAQQLELHYAEGFVKNRYVGRTFIMPDQASRQNSVRLKLNPIAQYFKGKNVLLVDDSIVRGTTCRRIIQMARAAGAKKIYFASAAPQVRFPNVYGIDMPCQTALIASGKTDEEIATLIDADWLIYLNLEAIYQAINENRPAHLPPIKRFEDSVFTGDYITGDIDQKYLTALAKQRHD